VRDLVSRQIMVDGSAMQIQIAGDSAFAVPLSSEPVDILKPSLAMCSRFRRDRFWG
jgi:hypothetical protein